MAKKTSFKLTHDNYYSTEANLKYFSNSQYKSFLNCEAKTMAKINGKWQDEDATALVQGKYVHAWNEGKLKEFKKNNPDIFRRDGELRSEFVICDQIINLIKNDTLFMTAVSGEKEKMFTAEYLGVEWKILIDSYFPKKKRFCDLKILKSLYDKFWNSELSVYDNVFEYRGYFTQIAIYAEIERRANNRDEGDFFEPFIAVATKEQYPDHEIISFTTFNEKFNDFINRQLIEVQKNIPRMLYVKGGQATPSRCEKCDYCRSTKLLKGTKNYSEFSLY